MSKVISKFGQYVLLSVHDEGGGLVLSTDSLRVDFDIRHIKNWSRAKFSIYNLAPETIRNISNGDNYVTIQTSLHDGELFTIADRMYVSNAMEERMVPNSVTSLYCYSKLRRFHLEKQIDRTVRNPTLVAIVDELTQAAGFKGSVEYRHFPAALLQYRPPRPISKHRGSLISCLEKLSSYYKFNVYTEGNNLVLMYKPEAGNVADTDLYTSAGDVVLDTKDMRANPKIGPATLNIVSNLNPKIKPTSILNTSQLVTAAADVDPVTLQVAEDYLKTVVAGFAKYQTLSVQHKGSNFTKDWITAAMATSPTKGTNMPTENWFR